MRSIVLLAFALTWVSCCTGCGQRPPASPLTSPRELAAKLEDETVAMVRLVDADGDPDPNGHARPFCAGVWVSPHAFITAGHCVEHREPEADLLESLGIEMPERSPLGDEALFAVDVTLGSYWTGRVAGYNKDLDLGLVVAEVVPFHMFARLGEGPIEAGDRVEVCGHPAGHVWSYAEGYVSAERLHEPNADRTPMPTLQVAAPFSPGNSGGGVFDSSGHLIGVASYIEPRANGMGFFVHRNAVRTFLVAVGVP